MDVVILLHWLTHDECCDMVDKNVKTKSIKLYRMNVLKTVITVAINT